MTGSDDYSTGSTPPVAPSAGTKSNRWTRTPGARPGKTRTRRFTPSSPRPKQKGGTIE
jgi:hypothetical protein